MTTLGYMMTTFAPISFRDMGAVAKKAEDLGFDRVHTSESLTDTLACNMWMVSQTSRITVCSSIAIIYMRHPLITAQAATTISDVSGGRYILGLGPGHPPRNEALGVTQGRPLDDLRNYVQQVRDIMEGRPVYTDLPLQTYQGIPLEIRRPQHPVPIHTGVVGPKGAEVAGAVTDGLVMYLVPLSRVGVILQAAESGAKAVGRDPGAVESSLVIHTLVDDDLETARATARETLTYWVGLPGYNRSIRQSGFEQEAKQIREAFLAGDQAGIRAGLSDDLLDQFCLLGPPGRCRDRIAEVRAAGVDVPIVMPDPVAPGETYPAAIERTLRALAP